MNKNCHEAYEDLHRDFFATWDISWSDGWSIYIDIYIILKNSEVETEEE